MKSHWKVSHTYVGGADFYQVYRLRDINGVDHSGNREVYKTCGSEEEAEFLADRLNERDEEHAESLSSRLNGGVEEW